MMKIVSVPLFEFKSSESGLFDELDMAIAEVNASVDIDAEIYKQKHFKNNESILDFLLSDRANLYIRGQYRKSLASIVKTSGKEYELYVFYDRKSKSRFNFRLIPLDIP